MYVRIELKSLYAEEPIGACSSFVCIQQYLAPINHVFWAKWKESWSVYMDTLSHGHCII